MTAIEFDAALSRFAKWFAITVLAALLGAALIPVVMPQEFHEHRPTVRINDGNAVHWRYKDFPEGADEDDFMCGYVIPGEYGEWIGAAYGDRGHSLLHFHERAAAIKYVELWCKPAKAKEVSK